MKDYASMTIAQLRAFIAHGGVSLMSCQEARRELDRRLNV